MIDPLASSISVIGYAPWETYKRPYVRDLAYALVCPNAITTWINFKTDHSLHNIFIHSSRFWLTQFAHYQKRLHELDTTNAYQDLTRYLLKRPSPNRLGFHFEGLLSFWLDDGYQRGIHAYETLASNVQLFENKQTIGELDVILYNHKKARTEHWELAIKFFMGSAPFEPRNWVGINSNDNLQRKMAHMQTKQFQSVWTDTPNHGRVKIDQRFAVIKGRFFLPMTETNFIYPSWLEQNFPMHRWLAAPNSQKVDDCLHHSEQHHALRSMPPLTFIRRARYIEWFTQRPFYDAITLDDAHSVEWQDLTTVAQGLYFVHIPSRHAFNTHYQAQRQLLSNKTDPYCLEPVVVLRTPVNAGQDHF